MVFDRDTEFEFQVAPMADMLFVLLVFFMSITSLDSLRQRRPMALPVVSAAGPDLQLGSISHQAIISVDWLRGEEAGSLELDGQAVDEDTLLAALRHHHEMDPDLRVLLRADRNAEYGRIASVLRLCHETGIGSITIAVQLPADGATIEKGQP
jgi:biopolymer transport protein ExbD